MPATAEALTTLPTSYEGWSCLENGTTVADGKLVRDPDTGKLVWAWRKTTPALSEADEAGLRAKGVLKAGEGWISMNGGDLKLERGSTHPIPGASGKYLLLSSGQTAGDIWASVSTGNSLPLPSSLFPLSRASFSWRSLVCLSI